VFPGVWRHGDFIKINQRGGCYIYGRSDSTLNRFGVRIGTAEIYRSVEQQPEVADSLIICCELPGGNFFMPLFVKMKPGFELTDDVRDSINKRLRKDYSPRHVPDKIYEVAAVPYTLTAKKLEVPVRKILMGWAPEKAVSRDAMTNPESLDYFIEFARSSTDYDWRVPEAKR
jgi:acetoacetyl-CoA synthetase